MTEAPAGISRGRKLRLPSRYGVGPVTRPWLRSHSSVPLTGHISLKGGCDLLRLHHDEDARGLALFARKGKEKGPKRVTPSF